jgi:hypothetical protein
MPTHASCSSQVCRKLVTTLALRSHLHAHDVSFILTLVLALDTRTVGTDTVSLRHGVARRSAKHHQAPHTVCGHAALCLFPRCGCVCAFYAPRAAPLRQNSRCSTRCTHLSAAALRFAVLDGSSSLAAARCAA